VSTRGKTANVVNVAIAREMVGFNWSIACTIQSMRGFNSPVHKNLRASEGVKNLLR
jgi:hypothetical protein